MWTQEKINEIYSKVQRLSMTDEEFRKELLENPGETIEKAAGEPMPKDFRVKIIENEPQYTATFVLPPMVSDELDEMELAQVAGGACLLNGCGLEACAADGTLKLK